jgi:hypothetical protein
MTMFTSSIVFVFSIPLWKCVDFRFRWFERRSGFFGRWYLLYDSSFMTMFTSSIVFVYSLSPYGNVWMLECGCLNVIIDAGMWMLENPMAISPCDGKPALPGFCAVSGPCPYHPVLFSCGYSASTMAWLHLTVSYFTDPIFQYCTFAGKGVLHTLLSLISAHNLLMFSRCHSVDFRALVQEQGCGY